MKSGFFVAALGCCALVGAQSIYAGGASSEKGYAFSNWGNGSISESKETAKIGPSSIRVVARGPYQGGQFTLSKPVDVRAALADPNSLLVFAVIIPEAGTGGGGGVSPGGPSGGGKPGGRLGGASIGGPAPGGPGGGGGGSDDGAKLNVRQIRVVIGTDDGKMTEVYFPVKKYFHSQGNWHEYAVPLSKLAGFASSSAKIAKFGFFSDAFTTYYIGEIAVVSDATPLTGEIMEMNTNLARGDEPLFAAIGNGGPTQLRFYWDWNAKDGVQRETEGAAVYHKFQTPGEYTVTLTVADAYDIKKPYTATIKVTVNP